MSARTTRHDLVRPHLNVFLCVCCFFLRCTHDVSAAVSRPCLHCVSLRRSVRMTTGSAWPTASSLREKTSPAPWTRTGEPERTITWSCLLGLGLFTFYFSSDYALFFAVNTEEKLNELPVRFRTYSSNKMSPHAANFCWIHVHGSPR